MKEFIKTTNTEQVHEGAGLYRIETPEEILVGCSNNIKKAVGTRLTKLKNKTGIFKNNNKDIEISYKTAESLESAIKEREDMLATPSKKPVAAI